MESHLNAVNGADTINTNDAVQAAATASAPAPATIDPTVKPDRSGHDTVKARYKMLQLKYTDLMAVSCFCKAASSEI